MRTRAMLFFIQLVSLTVSYVHTANVRGTHIVFEIGRTCCAAGLASATLG